MKRNTLTGQFILSACMFNLPMPSFISALSVKKPLCRSNTKVLEGITLPIASLVFSFWGFFPLRFLKITLPSINICKFWLLEQLWFPWYLPFFARLAFLMWLSPQTATTKLNSFKSQSSQSGIWEWGKKKQQPNNTLVLAFAGLTRKLEQTAGDRLRTLGLAETMNILFCFAMAP